MLRKLGASSSHIKRQQYKSQRNVTDRSCANMAKFKYEETTIKKNCLDKEIKTWVNSRKAR